MEGFDVEDINELYATEQEKIKNSSKDSDSIQNSFLKEVHIEEDIIPHNICDWIIEEAEQKAKQMGSWTSSRHKAYPTTDIPVVAIESIRNTLANIVHTDIFPVIRKIFGIEKYFLGINDLFVVKYDMYGQQSLEPHKDGSVFSFSILLNDPKDFEGGGTQIMSTEEIYKLNKGGLLIHSGYNKHSGVKITSGLRYLLVGFINYVPLPSCKCESCQKRKQLNWGKMNTKEECGCSECMKKMPTQPKDLAHTPPKDLAQPPIHTHNKSCPQHPQQKHEWEERVKQWEIQQEEDKRQAAANVARFVADARTKQPTVRRRPGRSMFMM